MSLTMSTASFPIVRFGLALALCAGTAQAQEATDQMSGSNHIRYNLIDLGALSGGFSQASYISNFGGIVGNSSVSSGPIHATLWYRGSILDLASNQPAGLNSAAYEINDFGLVQGESEISTNDPNAENFCSFFTAAECRAFRWQNGVLTPLPTLGGNNAAAEGGINDRGEIAGFSETSTNIDPDCPNTILPNGSGPQVLDYEAVIWGRGPNDMRPLHPLPGDTVSIALWLNQQGEAVGISGTCANTSLPGFAAGPHAVLWDRNGTPHNLPTFGGTSNLSLLGVGNGGYVINNRSQVAGVSALPGSTTYHAAFWDKESGIQDLGTLSGDLYSAGLGMNDEGTVVGGSLDINNNPTAFVWNNGKMSNLNCLVPANSPFNFLLVAFSVNDSGQIVGFGVTPDGPHAFLATPAHQNGPTLCSPTTSSVINEDAQTPKLVLSPDARAQLRQQLRSTRIAGVFSDPQ